MREGDVGMKGCDAARSILQAKTDKVKVSDKSPTRGVVCSWREKVLEAWAAYLAEEDQVKAWTLHQEIYTKWTYQDAQMELFRLRRHGKLEKQQLSTCHFSWGPGVHHRQWSIHVHDGTSSLTLDMN